MMGVTPLYLICLVAVTYVHLISSLTGIEVTKLTKTPETDGFKRSCGRLSSSYISLIVNAYSTQ